MIRVRSLGGLGALGALGGVAGMKASLNAIDRATGNKGTFNAGNEDSNLSAVAGWHVIRATVNLINRSVKAGGDLADMAGALIGSLSSAVGDAVSFIGTAADAVLAFAGPVLSYMADAKVGGVLWGLDQTVGDRHIEDFLKNATVVTAITALADAYLKAVNAGVVPGGTTTTSPTAPAPTTSGRILPGSRYRVAAHALTQPSAQVVFNEDTTPVRPTPSLAKPALVIGGAAVVAAFLLLR